MNTTKSIKVRKISIESYNQLVELGIQVIFEGSISRPQEEHRLDVINQELAEIFKEIK